MLRIEIDHRLSLLRIPITKAADTWFIDIWGAAKRENPINYLKLSIT